jgi:hypothetical protein
MPTALVDGALFWFLAVMTLLLVMCITAVILAPPQGPGPHTPQNYQATVPPLPLPGGPPPATTPARPLPRNQPPVTAPTPGVSSVSAADDETTELGGLQPVMHDRIPRPEVSGTPPWGPAPKPPGPHPWAAENPSPTWCGWPGEDPVSPHPGRHPSTKPPPGTRR